MTEPMRIGRIEQLSLTDLTRRGITAIEVKRDESDSELRDLVRQVGAGFQKPVRKLDEVTSEYSAGFRDGLNFQFESDCRAICWYCDSSLYEHAVYDTETDSFVHQKKDGAKKEHCDASLLFDRWAEDHKGQ